MIRSVLVATVSAAAAVTAALAVVSSTGASVADGPLPGPTSTTVQPIPPRCC